MTRSGALRFGALQTPAMDQKDFSLHKISDLNFSKFTSFSKFTILSNIY